MDMISLLIGIGIGMGIIFLYNYVMSFFKKKKLDPYINSRRGIYQKEFTMNSSRNDEYHFDVVFEITELKVVKNNSGTMISKIRVDDINIKNSRASSKENISKIMEMIDGSWVESDAIIFLDDDIRFQRSEKLKTVLK